ncbi:unnamed protein product [Callosobruchus maculatus]|uniref:Uncharacterized protein n=1 Tax=Callosobruchus maculatus TaxID=64391 RepID=A0A653BD79_CALMS|nr:unnamed protein product [Callosobruchus maculatus]
MRMRISACEVKISVYPYKTKQNSYIHNNGC